MGLLLTVAIMVVYIVLGVLYESYIHPITILSGLPSAGFGALSFDLSSLPSSLFSDCRSFGWARPPRLALGQEPDGGERNILPAAFAMHHRMSPSTRQGLPRGGGRYAAP